MSSQADTPGWQGNETPFYKTQMGQQFFDRTVPELVGADRRRARLLLPNDAPSHLTQTGVSLTEFCRALDIRMTGEERNEALEQAHRYSRMEVVSTFDRGE